MDSLKPMVTQVSLVGHQHDREWCEMGYRVGEVRRQKVKWSMCKALINMSNWKITIKIKNKQKEGAQHLKNDEFVLWPPHVPEHPFIFVHTKWWAIQSVVMHICNCNTWEMKVGSEVQGYLQLCNEFKAVSKFKKVNFMMQILYQSYLKKKKKRVKWLQHLLIMHKALGMILSNVENQTHPSAYVISAFGGSDGRVKSWRSSLDTFQIQGQSVLQETLYRKQTNKQKAKLKEFFI